MDWKRFKLALGLLLLATAMPAVAQFECGTLTAIQIVTDNLGKQHQAECWDPVGQVISFPSSTLVASVTITPAQFKAMDGTPATDVIVIPSPGSGFNIVPIMAVVTMPFNSIPYATGTGLLNFTFTDKVVSVADAFMATFLTSANIKSSVFQSQVAFWVSSAGSLTGNFSGAGFNNKGYGLNITNATPYTAGDSPFRVKVVYLIVPRT